VGGNNAVILVVKMIILIRCIFICIFLIFTCVSCVSCLGVPSSELTRDFLKLSRSEREVKILDYPLAKQVELYIEIPGYTHPPDTSLRRIIAKHGREIIPSIKDALLESKEDFEILDLINLLIAVEEENYFKIKDESLFIILDKKINLMRDESQKCYALERMKRIKGGQIKLVSCFENGINKRGQGLTYPHK
jgi:hypothetical protein